MDEFEAFYSHLSPIEKLKFGLQQEGVGVTPAEQDRNGLRMREIAIDAILGGRTAYEMGRDTAEGFQEGGIKGGAREAGLSALETALTVLASPFGRSAENAAQGATSRANVFVPAPNDQVALQARGMRERGASSRDVFDATKRFFGFDGRLKQEIPDAPMQVHAGNRPIGSTDRLGDVIDHPAVLDRYPQFGDLTVEWVDRVNKEGRPIARSDPQTGVLELNASIPDLRPDVAKLLQYKIGEQERFAGSVRHGYDKVKEDIDNAEALVRRAGVRDELAEPYVAMLDRNRSLMGHLAREKGLAAADQSMGAHSAGNIEAKYTQRRAAIEALQDQRDGSMRPVSEFYPIPRKPKGGPRRAAARMPKFEDVMVLPPAGAREDEIADFLANWQRYGSGRGP